MDENSTQVVRRYFREYYFRHGSRIKSPSEIASREFGYFPFGGAMIRHQSFKDIGAFRALLVKEAPAGVYCSNSLYNDPSAEMHLKGWIRAELIFDIDADALRLPCKREHDVWLCKACGEKRFGLRPEVCLKCKENRILEMSWACPLCLEGTKKETSRLLDFLEFDFGILPSMMKVCFSGNAGYHVSVDGSVYESLDTHGRAEIADYLAGRGIMPSFFNSTRLSPNDPGWRGRVARFMRDLPEGDPLFKTTTYEKRLSELVNDFSKKQVEQFLQRSISDNAVRIDAMVTTDIHRIFRMPETLNNKTGLVKRECTDLAAFDPEIEAIALKEEPQRARVSVDMAPRISLNGASYGPFNSEIVELPMYVAVYLVCKGAAKFVTADQGATPAEKQKA